MEKFEIRSKDGVVRHVSITQYNSDGEVAYADSLEYHGTWMGDCFVTLNIKSAYPIDFHIGDYVMYRGEKFVLNYDPTIVKKARRGTYGEGFTYDSIKFNALHYELTDVRFLDYVLNDNELHWSSLPDFPFYAASIDDFADRLQANTNRYCADNGFSTADYWVFLTPSTDGNGVPVRSLQRLRTAGFTDTQILNMWHDAYGEGVFVDEEKKDVSTTITDKSVWDSMSMIKDNFGLNFIIRGRHAIIGAAGIPTNKIFKYGKSGRSGADADECGLYEIERVADTDQQVITKIFGYGSDNNLPVRYYANLGMRCYATVTRVVKTSPLRTVLLDLQYNESYFTNKMAGSPEFEVTVREENSSHLEGGMVYHPLDSSTISYTDAERLQCELTVGFAETYDVGDVLIFEAGIDKDKWPAGFRTVPSNLPTNMAVNRLMLPAFPTMSLYDWIVTPTAQGGGGGTAVTDSHNDSTKGRATWTINGKTYDAFFSKDQYDPFIISLNAIELGIREGIKTFDGSDGTDAVYPTIENTGADHIVSADLIEDNGVSEEEPKTFDIILPSFGAGFDLQHQISVGQNPTISMKNGFCGGREFSIESAKQLANDTWKVTVHREYDDLLAIWFPYNYLADEGTPAAAGTAYQLAPNDNYVLTGIPMTDTYVAAASVKLLERTLEFLAKNDYVRYTYLPKVDEIYMARQHRDTVAPSRSLHDTLKEGDIMLFADADLLVSNGRVFIDQLTIKESGNNGIPTYDVVLRDDKQVGSIQRLQNQIDSMTSGGFGGGMSASQLQAYIEAFGNNLFLSKRTNDIANGLITFLRGLQVGNNFVSGLLGSGGIFRRNADGKTYLETDNLYVRMKAYFDTVEVREYEHSHGGRIASSAGQKVSHVVKMGYYPEGSQTKVPLDDDNYYHYIDPATGDETLIPLDICCYRCYYRAKENSNTTEQATRQNTFKRGDMARCHMVNDSLNQKDYWRIVDETNEYDTFYNGEYGWTDLTNEAHFDVTGTSTCWGYMGASTGDTADVPEMGDDLYQLGSVTDADRQGAIVEATTGNDTPAYRIYQSVGKDLRPTPAQGQPPLSEFDPFTLEDRDYINLFYNSATGRAQMDVYGDAYIGAKDGSTYINYNAGTRKLNIKAIVDIAGGFLDGGTQKTFDQLLSGRTYTQAQVDAMIEGIQKQIDGEIDTWFYDYMPVDFEATEPANKVPLLFYEKDGVSYPCQPYYDWFVADHGDPTTTPITQPTTDVERNKHLGDIFYDNTSGYAFRFSKDENTGDFEWVEITDSAVIKALRDAANAQDTADNKRRVFVAQPAPIPPKTYVEYDVGDLWTNANFTGSDSHGQAVVYSNDLLRCITAKPIRDAQGNITDGTFSIDDWQLASKYTDDTALTNFISGAYATTISLLQGQIDKKAQTWYQDQNPATTAAPNGWYVQGENHDAEHVGDLWYCTDDIVDPNTKEVIFGKDTTWYFQVDNTGSTPRYYWQQQNIPSEVFDKIDGKCQIFVNDPTATPPSYPTNYQSEDLWILPQAATINGVSYIQGEILTSTADSDTYVASHWVKKVGYTNDDTVNAIIQRYGQILNITPTAQDLGQALGYLEKVLSTGSTSVDGGLVLTNIIYMKDVGTTPQVRAGLSGLLKETETGTGWKGYGTAAWYGGGVNNGVPIDKEASPALSNYAKSLFRFDGSGYLAGGNITWDANGSVTIRNITTLYDSQNTNILNELTTFSNMFGNSTWGVEPNTELRIQPKQHFDHINLTRGTGSVGGDSHYFDITDVSVLNYGEMKTRFLQSDLFWLLFGVYSSDGTTDLTSTFISTGALPTGAVIKAKTGLFTDSFLSALGLNPNSGGGGGTGDVTWDALASSQDSRPISWEHIETAVTQQGYITSALLAAYLTTNGYATQSWVGQQGYITSSSLNGYATESWVNSLLANYYTKSQVDSLTWLQGISQEESGLLTISVHGGEGYILDLTHSHSFYEIVNRPNTLNGYGITDALNSSTTFWGQNAISGGNVSGSIEAGSSGGSIGGFHSIELNSHGTLPDYGGYVDFHFNGSSSDFTSRIIEKAGGIVSIESISTTGLVIGGSNGDFVQIGAIRIGYDSANNALKVYKIVSGSEVAANLYALGGISALGYGVSGGSGSGDVTWTALAQTAASGRFIDWSYIETAVTQQGYITSALLAAYLTTNGYATQSWVGQQGFLTSQDITANLINNALGFTLSGTSGSTYNLDNFALASALSNYLPLTGGTMTGSLKQEAEIHLYDKTAPSRGYARIRQDGSNGLYISWEDQNVGTALTETLNVDGNIYMDTKLVATQNWVGLNYTDTVTLNTMLGNYLLKSGGTMTGTLYMGVGTYLRLYEDANSYASIYASATDGLSIGFNNGATVAAINLDANTEIGGTLGVTGNVTVGHPNTNGGFIQIGGVRLVYDSTNNALYVVSSDGSTAANFYATGGNSALGYSPSGSGGGGTGDVTWTALAAQATNNRTIHSSYIADTLANYLLVSGGTVTGDLTLLGNVFATTSAFNINHLYLTTGFRIQMVDRLNDNHNVIAFDTNNNFVFSLGTHNAKFIASDLLVGTNTVWHGGNFPLAISSPTSGQVLKFNGTSWVNDAAPTGGGTVTSITAGTGLSGGTITGSGTIAIDSTYQTYISNGNTAYGWGNHANAGYATTSALASYLPLSAGTSYPITGALCLSALNEIRLYQDATHYARITPDTLDGLTIGFSAGNTMNQLNLPSNTYIGSDIVASQTWVGQQGFALASAIPTNNNQLTNGAGYITASALNGYATQTWVGQQGYITSSSISDMATMTWVANQDYVSTSDLNTTLSSYALTSQIPTNNNQLTNGAGYITVSALSGYATQSWVRSQGYLTDVSQVDRAFYLISRDMRSSYPSEIVAGARAALAFVGASILGISDGTSVWFDTFILRSYFDDSAGGDNAIMFSKQNGSVWHTVFPYGTSSTWGTPVLFIDTQNWSNHIGTSSNPVGYAGQATTAGYATNAGAANTLTTARTIWGQSFNGGSSIDGAFICTDNTYFKGSPSYGFRFNDHNSTYNNFIIYENGNTYTRGNVGIGTTNPTYTLDVAGSVNSTGNFVLQTDGKLGIRWADNDSNMYSYIQMCNAYSAGRDENGGIQYHSGKWSSGNIIAHRFYTNNNSSALTIDNNGNVGIGIVWPSYKLHVNDDTYITGNVGIGTAPISANKLNVSGSVRASGFVNYYSDNSSVLLGGGGTAAVSSLSVAYSTRTTYMQCPDWRNNTYAPSALSANNGLNGFWYFAYKDAIGMTETYSGVYTIRPYGEDTDWSGGDAHQFAVNNSGLYHRRGNTSWGSWYEIVTTESLLTGINLATSSGNVGIGTTSPSYKLHVDGDIYSSGTIYGTVSYAASAGSATSAGNANTVGNYSVSDIIGLTFNGTQDFLNNANTVVTNGAYPVRGASASNYPSGFTGGECVVFRSSGMYANAQLAFNSSDSTMWMRTGYGDSNNISWNGWTSFLTNPMTTHLSFNSSCDIRMYDDSTHYTSIHEDSDGLNIGFANSNSNGNLVVAGGIENTGSVTVGNTLTVNGYAQFDGSVSFSADASIENGDFIVDCINGGVFKMLGTDSSNNQKTFTLKAVVGYGSTVKAEGVNTFQFGDSTHPMVAYAYQHTTYSDSRVKDILDYDADINLWDIAYAPSIHFTNKYGEDRSMHVGSIAQYWEVVCPEAVTKDDNGYLGMQYDVIALLSAISIAKKTIEHERRISELERENAILRSRIETLETA